MDSIKKVMLVLDLGSTVPYDAFLQLLNNVFLQTYALRSLSVALLYDSSLQTYSTIHLRRLTLRFPLANFTFLCVTQKTRSYLLFSLSVRSASSLRSIFEETILIIAQNCIRFLLANPFSYVLYLYTHTHTHKHIKRTQSQSFLPSLYTQPFSLWYSL